MADFSTKKISEVHTGILHTTNVSNTITGTVSTSDLQIKTGADGNTPIHLDNTHVSLNHSTDEATAWKKASGYTLDARNTDGTGGTIFAGEVTVWQGSSSSAWGTQSQGGKLNIKDGSSAPDSGTSDDSFFIDNYHDGTDFVLRCIRRESGGDGAGTDVDTKLFTALQKNQQAYFTIGDTATLEQFTCEGKISTAGTSLGPRYNEIFVNSRTTGTYPGDDDNPGSRTQPYKTLSKAMYNCCPYSVNVVYLYAGTSGSDITTYKICSLDLKGLNISIRPCHSDTNGPDGQWGEPFAIDDSDGDLGTCRDNTVIQQSTDNELEAGGAIGTTAQWKLWNGTSLSIEGVTIQVSYPGAKTVGKDKTPFNLFYNAGGMLSLGKFITSGYSSTKVHFQSQNTDGGGASTDWTVLLTNEYSEGAFLTKNVYYQSSLTAHNQARLDGPGGLAIRQSGHEYPTAWATAGTMQSLANLTSSDEGTAY